MKRTFSLGAGIILVACCLSWANAAEVPAPGKGTQRGLENSRKTMERTIERSKKMQELKTRAKARKKQLVTSNR